ncbi:hypothetical protein [Microcoleus sp. D3_18a_C4]|uniref:hypothetical protein n=1 Tax=unclassified Microcoleus TaxID=2642155 RepID=UPI002FD6AF6C
METFGEKTLKTHEIYEITEKRKGWEIEEGGKWYEIRDEWGCTLAYDEHYAEHGTVTVISGDPKRNFNYAFDTYEAAFEFAYNYEQSSEYLELQELNKNMQIHQPQEPY